MPTLIPESSIPEKDQRARSSTVEEFLSWMKGSVKETTITNSWRPRLNEVEAVRQKLGMPEFPKFTIRDLARIKEEIEAKSAANWYISAYLLPRFFTYLEREDLSKQIPVPKYFIVTKEPLWFQEEDIPRIVDSVETYQDRSVLQLGYDLGLRVMETTLLDKAGVNLQDHIATVKRLKSRKRLFWEHDVPFSEKAGNLLKLYFDEERGYDDEEPALFVRGEMGKQKRTRHFNRISRRTVDNIFYRALEKTKMNGETKDGRKFTFHSLRHSKGTHLALEGADIVQIAKHLGHTSTNSTLIYIHLAGKALAERQRKLSRRAEAGEA